MKTCTQCKTTKKLADFHSSFGSPDGRHTICKMCRSPVDKSTVQKVLDAVIELNEPVTAHIISEKTGVPPRVVSSRLSFLRTRGDVFPIQNRDGQDRGSAGGRGLGLVHYVHADHPLAEDQEKRLCRVSNAWVAAA